jgi:hypothetical protein
MARFDIDSYRANFQGGARQYLFYFKPNFPGAVAGANPEIATFLVRATTLPETTSEEITLNWQGFDMKVAGKYTYADWTVTFNVDMDAKIEQMFHNWATLIHDPTTNVYSKPTDYFADQQIELLGIDGNPVMKYKLIGAWPKSIGQSTLDYSANDVLQFDVNFTYIYHTTDVGTYGKPPTYS